MHLFLRKLPTSTIVPMSHILSKAVSICKFLWNTPLIPYLMLHNHLESAKKPRLLAHLYYQKSWRCISSFVKLPQMSRTANMGDNGWFAITHFFLSIDIQTCPLAPVICHSSDYWWLWWILQTRCSSLIPRQTVGNHLMINDKMAFRFNIFLIMDNLKANCCQPDIWQVITVRPWATRP